MAAANQANERNFVEIPLLQQLASLGYTVIDLTTPSERANELLLTGRDQYGQTYLPNELRQSIQHLNPWLEPDQVTAVMHELLSVPPGSLVQRN